MRNNILVAPGWSAYIPEIVGARFRRHASTGDSLTHRPGRWSGAAVRRSKRPPSNPSGRAFSCLALVQKAVRPVEPLVFDHGSKHLVT